jgi:multidrug resistance efflux pump
VGSDWALVRRGDLVLGVDVTGSLKSADTIQLGPPGLQEMWQFSITFLAPEGSEVVAGERVLAFDPKSLTKRLAAKRNEAARSAKELEKKLTATTMARRDEQLRLAEAEAAVRRARMQVSTSPELVASVELRSSRLDLQLAEAELEAERRKSVASLARDAAEVGALEGTLRRAEARVDELNADIERMSVTAPRAGALLHVARHGRDKPKVGDSLWRGRKVVEVVALDDLHGDGEVDEMDGSRIEVGQPVKLRLDAHPDVQLKGEVESVLQSVQRRSRDDPRKVVRVRITVSPTQTVQLRPGMRFRGTIETGRLEHVLLVASDAVFLGSGGAVVWRQRARGAESVAVRLGARNGTDVQLLGGVGEGDRLSRTRPTGAGAP